MAIAQSGHKNLYLPGKKGKVLIYEDHSNGGKFRMEREYIGKSKKRGKDPIFLETLYLDDKEILDTVSYFCLSEGEFKGMLIGLVNKYDSTYAYRGCIPTYLDSLHYRASDYIIHHQLHFMEFVNIGRRRFDNVLITMSKVKAKQDEGDPIDLETMEFFYAAKIGLIAQVNTDSSGAILGSLELKHPQKGKWIELHANGSPSARMKYKKGERHGKYTEWHS
ncbi:MAG: hypothetical protein JKX73_08535, partial [Flavobacteriales bacterium]|nr:hypothetical protein [Flavobacteriales bacterium]